MNSRKTPLKGEIKLLKSNIVFSNQYAEIHNDFVRYPGGTEGTYIKVISGTSQSVAVLPITEKGNMIVIRLYRYGVGGWGVEIPKGAVEKDESAANAAARELMEETGYTCRRLIPIGEYSESPAVFGTKMVCFIAIGCKYTAPPKREDAEAIDQAIEIPVEDFLQQKYEADFTDSISELLAYKYLSVKEMIDCE